MTLAATASFKPFRAIASVCAAPFFAAGWLAGLLAVVFLLAAAATVEGFTAARDRFR